MNEEQPGEWALASRLSLILRITASTTGKTQTRSTIQGASCRMERGARFRTYRVTPRLIHILLGGSDVNCD